jgi:hypothetical protein
MQELHNPAAPVPSPQQTGVIADPDATWSGPGSDPAIWGGSLAAANHLHDVEQFPVGTPERVEDAPHHESPGQVSTPLPSPSAGWSKPAGYQDGENLWLGNPKGVVP